MKLFFRSDEAIAMARSLLPNYEQFAKAEEIIYEVRIAHADMASRDMATDQAWEAEERALRLAEEIDPDHAVRRREYFAILSGVDEVVDGAEPITYRTMPPWGRSV